MAVILKPYNKWVKPSILPPLSPNWKSLMTYWSHVHQVGIQFKHSLVQQNPIRHRLWLCFNPRRWWRHMTWEHSSNWVWSKSTWFDPLRYAPALLLHLSLLLDLSLCMTGICGLNLPCLLVCTLTDGRTHRCDTKLKPLSQVCKQSQN